MKTRLFVFLFSLALVGSAQNGIAEKLGYPSDARMLIIHADDLGVTHSENAASIAAIENGSVNSASVMMPTPWVLEAAAYANQHPETHDFGLHLVLSSEWKNYKWGPVSSVNAVPSLVDQHGYFHPDCIPDMNVAEVEREIKAQIDRAYAMGFEPTHLDSHMGCMFQTPELIEVYFKMAQSYRLPMLVTRQFPETLLKKYEIKAILEEVIMIEPEQYANGTEAYYVNAIKNLKPGLSIILLHAGFDNDELKAMATEHPDYGNEWRQRDFDFFTSDACRDLLKEENIKLVTWREIRDALYRKPQ